MSRSVNPTLPDQVAIQRLAATVMKTTIARVVRLDGYLYSTHQLIGAGGSFCLLKCSPSAGKRLLTCEEDRLGVEASVLSLLGRRVDVAAPKLLEYQAATASVGGSYIISGPFSGSIMGSMSRASSASERIIVDRNLGAYLQRLATIGNRSFGPFRRPSTSSWATYFSSLLESILSDGEASAINLPSNLMRQMIVKHRSSLDGIEQAKLVLLEVASTDNIVVDERTHDITSLIDYSTAIWGDPFLSDAFHRPSRSFVEGFGEGVDGDNDKRIRHLL